MEGFRGAFFSNTGPDSRLVVSRNLGRGRGADRTQRSGLCVCRVIHMQTFTMTEQGEPENGRLCGLGARSEQKTLRAQDAMAVRATVAAPNSREKQ